MNIADEKYKAAKAIADASPDGLASGPGHQITQRFIVEVHTDVWGQLNKAELKRLTEEMMGLITMQTEDRDCSGSTQVWHVVDKVSDWTWRLGPQDYLDTDYTDNAPEPEIHIVKGGMLIAMYPCLSDSTDSTDSDLQEAN